ncbi:MAG: hypothetical protein ACLP7Q_10230 [Isosphaeraceae bacterium]
MAVFFPPLVVVPLWIYLSIRWVDQHGGWEVTPAPAYAPPAAAAYAAAGLNPPQKVTPAPAYAPPPPLMPQRA